MRSDGHLKVTEDGSHTLFSERFCEHYHSTHGAIQESRHVFISSGLAEVDLSSPSILEIGFGTGLNALLSLIYGQENDLPIRYTTIEMYPMSTALVELINYTETLGYADEYRLLHNSEWEEWINITSYFHLKKLEGDLVTTRLTDAYDLIYFDAFSPEAQPELWKESIFGKIANVCNPGAVLTTYSAKGAVRRSLQASGFEVERIPGPPGKREMIRARKL